MTNLVCPPPLKLGWQDPQHPMCPRKIKYDPAVVSWQPPKKCGLGWRWQGEKIGGALQLAQGFLSYWKPWPI